MSNVHKSASGPAISIIRAGQKLANAIEQAGGDASIAIMAPEPVGTAFRAFVEAVRLNQIEVELLQDHMEREVKRLDDEAQP